MLFRKKQTNHNHLHGTELQTVLILKKVMPAVVTITLTKSLEDLEKDSPEIVKGALQNKEQEALLKKNTDSNGRIQIGGGSGFIVDLKGIILTNKHVISESHVAYSIILEDGTKYNAEVVASDPMNDVAILKIKDKIRKKLPVVELGNSHTLELGQTVFAIGNVLGVFKNTVSKGIVSGLFRTFTAQTEKNGPSMEMRGLIQTDAAINPGNSGGPLIDIRGHAIGINTAVVSEGQNIGLAIPIQSALRDLEDIQKFGKIRRPLLGVRYITLNQELQQKLKTPVPFGALVTNENRHETAVVKNTPADKAGIKENDIILEWDSKHITEDQTIQDLLEECTVGDEVKLTLLRKNEHIDTVVKLTERK